ncbi:hypothetical protein KKA95_01610 [Patescibacteria group bacterium]|nr:hypothetical protein [Patescibacteria group bacterium]
MDRINEQSNLNEVLGRADSQKTEARANIERITQGLMGELDALAVVFSEDLREVITASDAKDRRSSLLSLLSSEAASQDHGIADKVSEWADKKQIPEGHPVRNDITGYIRGVVAEKIAFMLINEQMPTAES